MARRKRRKGRRMATTHFDSAIKKCKLAKGPFDATVRLCDWCGKNLPPRRRRWCSDAHMNAAVRNHVFSVGRVHALKAAKGLCAKCGMPGFRRGGLEVNHITPCKGKHSMAHCSHHLSNLEVLCHVCHVEETNRQRKAGEFK